MVTRQTKAEPGLMCLENTEGETREKNVSNWRKIQWYLMKECKWNNLTDLLIVDKRRSNVSLDRDNLQS